MVSRKAAVITPVKKAKLSGGEKKEIVYTLSGLCVSKLVACCMLDIIHILLQTSQCRHSKHLDKDMFELKDAKWITG